MDSDFHKIIEEFHFHIDHRHEYAKSLKRKGKLLAGYMCTHIPEEILYAGGIIPLRILSSHDSQALTRSYMHETYCSFSHDCAYEGLSQNYDYLDLIVMGTTCLHMSEAFNVWVKFGGFKERSFLILFPHIMESKQGSKFLLNSFGEFKKFLEDFKKNFISDYEIEDAIKVYNQTRRLLRKLWQFLKDNSSIIRGADLAAITLASQLMDKREFNEMLGKLIDGLKCQDKGKSLGVRLMVSGGACDDIRIFELIESLNYKVDLIFIDSCTVGRYFWFEVLEDQSDKLRVLSEGYLDRIPCPSKDNILGTGEKKRFRFIQEFIEDFRPDGIVFLYQRFCSPQPHDIVALKPILNRLGIPYIELELDTTIPINQFKNRLEAFVETIKGVELVE